jgi:hypothetical protein
MDLMQHVREALDRRRIQRAHIRLDGYHLEDGPSRSVVVRWGHGDPFDGAEAPERCLRRCARTLTSQRFAVSPGVPTDERGAYIVVLRRPSRDA